jgi:hypothetical protein
MTTMYVMKNDYSYFEVLYGHLDQVKRLKFLKLLKSAASEKAGVEITTIRVIDDSTLGRQAIAQNELITRTMIKKTYISARDGK